MVRPPANIPKELAPHINDIYKHINEIRTAVMGKTQVGTPSDHLGEEGSLRLMRGNNNEYYLQARSKDGWITSSKGVMQFLQNKDTVPSLVASTSLSIGMNKQGQLTLDSVSGGSANVRYGVSLLASTGNPNTVTYDTFIAYVSKEPMVMFFATSDGSFQPIRATSWSNGQFIISIPEDGTVLWVVGS